jgi:nitrogenase molybdenum-iron protein alpha/beta subunit
MGYWGKCRVNLRHVHHVGLHEIDKYEVQNMPLKHYEHCCSTIQALASLGKIEGVIPLLHGPQPCSYQNQVGSMSCRPANLVTAGTLVNKSDVIFGGEEGLKQQVKNLHEKYHPKVIVIINTCIPQLIGEDIAGVIIELAQELPDLKVSTCVSGFNFPRSMPLGSDAAWVAVIDTFEKQDKVPGSIGLIGRTGQDAGNLACLEMFFKKAGIPSFVFPTPHIDSMSEIVRAEKYYPIHITPWLTCKHLSEHFGGEVEFIEIPVGIQGTSNFLRAIAERQNSQKLHDLVDEEEKRVQPELEKIRARFAREKVRMLMVDGPANEVSVGKIFAEFGAEVFVVPSMKNKFYQQEKKIMQERYGVTFIEEDFDLLGDIIDQVKPTAVSVEFQAQPECVSRLVPTFINMLYLCEYGYDYAIDLGTHFFKNMHKPVYETWQGLMKKYGG